MKMFIEKSSLSINKIGGKALFCRRLADEFRKVGGIDITDDENSEADVSLNVIRIKHQKSKVKILRIDGVWHDTAKNYRHKNRAIQINLRQADGVIYQSYFAKAMADEYLGEVSCPTKVIYNGSDPSYYEKIKSLTPSEGKVVIAFSKWRPHKRLRDIIESFLLAGIENGLLVVAGDTTKSGLLPREFVEYNQNPSVQFIGNIPQFDLASYLVVSKASIHLCWFDACPNSVVEAICAGVPVICNNVGGTWEIVGPSGGYICMVDREYDLNPVDLYNPPRIDRHLVAENIVRALKEEPVIINRHVNIKNIAGQYLQFIKELI